MPSRPGPQRSSWPDHRWWLAGAAVLLTVLLASAAGVFRHFEPADVHRGDALVRGLVGGVLGGLFALLVTRSLRQPGGDVPDRRTVQALTVMLVCLFAIVAITTAPRTTPISDDAATSTTAALLPSTPTTDSGPPAARPDDDRTRSSQDVGSAVMGVVIAFGLAAIVAIMLTYRRIRDDRRGRLAPWASAPRLPDPDPLDEETAAQTFAETARLLLADDDPRRAVIAAYAALLDGLAAAGVPRERYEGPEEHLHRALAALEVPADAAAAVTRLFVLARFSEHPVTDADRHRAIDALTVAEQSLRERSVPA